MTSFCLNLKNEKIGLYNRLSKLIIFILLIFFGYIAVFSDLRHVRIKSIGSVILLVICYGLQYYFGNTKYRFGHRPFFFVIIIGWISLEQYWMAGITLVFDLFSMITTRKLNVYFTKDHIQYPSFPVKQVKWSELNQVILKDGLLTIDFKSNRLIQQMIADTKTAEEEKEFNDFCRQQLKR